MLDRNPRGHMPFERRSHYPVVLFVDDDREVLSALRRTLSMDSYEVITAQGADEALCWLEELPIDLGMTDQRMPGLSGTELLREVRKRSPRTARALLTAFLSPLVATEGREAGVEAFLSKPWSDDLLRETVRRLLAETPS